MSRAAKDGLLEVLKEATNRDCNGRDEQGMTPTLYAAFYGNLEALRLLCGRGGDPDKADYFGNTALHLAAAQGHVRVVTFLVNFGANIYCTDIDGRTAQELAGINNREDILRFLDGVSAKLEASDKRKAKTMKEKAKESAKKRIKEYNKRKAKTEQLHEKLERRKTKEYKPSMINTIKQRIKSGSMSNLSNVPPERRNTFSDIVMGGTVKGTRPMGTVQRKILANKNSRLGQMADDDFKISTIQDGKSSVSKLTGIRRDSEVMYGGTLQRTAFEPHRRGRLDGIFNEAEDVDGPGGTPPPSNGMIRSMSQPDFLAELERNGDKPAQEPSSIFIRPGMGSIVIRKSLNTFGSFYQGVNRQEESSIGSGESYGHSRVITDDELSDSETSEEDNPNAPLERFLTAFGLGEYLTRFEEQKIDLDTLLILTENDLKSLNLPLGPYRKLVNAINERKAALENPGEVTDSML
ncbi:pre-mRNA splicing regulator USH1G isoform X2 [Cylas formicarius]|uniref:pre-mRNA splicing regulator USH1G isoform X2 n=1 Tax=Cylas formicarius TaxID=197179 RepID=UPI002958CF12|nr:pre-mRNA splicing regulator USH1G isoform X2 [Cylas formicarius]